MRSFQLLLVAATGLAAAPLLRESGFQAGPDGRPAGWSVWSPRAEIAPRTYVDSARFRSRPGSLAVSGNSNAAAMGGWERVVPGVQTGKWYRLTVHYRCEGRLYEPVQVFPRLDWVTAGGARAGRPDYAYKTTPADKGWTRVHMDAPAPEQATAVKIQLFLLNAPQATVWWDDISLEETEAPAPRRVTIATVNHRPSRLGSPEANVKSFLDTVDREAPGKLDLILLPEGITVVGLARQYAEVAEPVPGPTTKQLGEAARRRGAWVAAGLYEREGQTVYNTAVLMDRQGNFAGKYRKVYIPREETDAGITPGDDYPVFHTDFGTIGMMICWDVQFADPARALALRGAEIILLPIWGGNNTLTRARAIENRVFLVASGYDCPTRILDPDGEVLALAKERGTVAVATVDLSKRYLEAWLGDMRGRFMKELRVDLPVDPVRALR